jgi:hypothetical protein
MIKMATQFAPPPVPASVAAPPFLLARPQADDMGWNCRSALLAAAAAERADDTPRNTRGRIAYLLCEFGFQLARRRIDAGAALPLTRVDIADALGISLCRVKRTLALLSLSSVLECNGATMRITDWPRLCSVASYAASRLALKEDEEELDLACVAEEEGQPQILTRSGEPACFV